MRILKADSLKRLAEWALNRVASAVPADIPEDLRFAGDPVTRILNECLLEAAGNVRHERTREVVTKFGQLGIWVPYKDSAYQDVRDWFLAEILDRADELRANLNPAHPDRAYINVWQKAGEESNRLREKGLLAPGEIGSLESQFTMEDPDPADSEL